HPETGIMDRRGARGRSPRAAARRPQPALADRRLEALRQVLDEVEDGGLPRGGPQIAFVMLAPEHDVRRTTLKRAMYRKGGARNPPGQECCPRPNFPVGGSGGGFAAFAQGEDEDGGRTEGEVLVRFGGEPRAEAFGQHGKA